MGVLGLLCCLLAALTAQRELLWLGLLGLLAPAGSLVSLLIPAGRLRLDRQAPGLLTQGEQQLCTLTLTSGPGPSAGPVQLTETVDAALGANLRSQPLTLPGQTRTAMSYPVTGARRGHFRLGPLQVRRIDPLGLADQVRTIGGVDQVVVTPRVHPLLGRPLEAMGVGMAAEAQRSGLSGTADVLVREYRRGDDLRRIHWRSTARHDQLMVRREESARDQRARILLDSRLARHAGSGEHGSFEWAVSMVASLGVHLLEQGFQVELRDAEGLVVNLARSEHERQARELLLALADQRTSNQQDLGAGLDADGSELDWDLRVAVLGRLSPADLAALLGTGRRGGALALLLDVDIFSGLPATPRIEEQLATLRQHGWRAVRVEAGSSVPTSWQSLLGGEQD